MKKYLLILLLTSWIFPAFSQNRQAGDIPSPNASDLGKFGCFPVSYYTGRPNISIPLYELKVRDYTLPIKLQYDPSGVQMNNLPGWTGHNWTLSVGGAITRSVQGRYDEYVYPKGSLSYTVSNYFHTYGRLNQILENEGNDRDHTILKDSLDRGYSDFAPDIFYFNMPGGSGKFFLGNDGEWKVQSEQDFEVIFDVSDENNYISPLYEKYPSSTAINKQPKTIKGFIIRDGNGTSYHFGGSKNYIEYSIPFFCAGDSEDFFSWIANTWYLQKIVDRHGNVLFTFNYQRGKFIGQFVHQIQTARVETQDTWGMFGTYGDEYFSYDSDRLFTAMLISPLYLSTIKALDGRTIQFYSSDLTEVPIRTIYPYLYTYGIASKIRQYVNKYFNLPFYYLQSDDANIMPYQNRTGNNNRFTDPLSMTCLRKLNYIVLSQKSNTPGSLIYHFDYDYTKRMHLKDVKIMDDRYYYDRRNAVQGEYTFVYNHFDRLPADYFTKAIDHGGYYNGRDYDFSLSETSMETFFAQREPSLEHAQYGMLTDIIYPTGGRTHFEYEQNTYQRYMSDNRQAVLTETTEKHASGLRIKKMTEYEDSTNNHILQTRTYSYINPITGKSSGELFAKPKYYWPNIELRNGDAYARIDVFRSSSIIPLSNSFGPSIGYSYVTETFGDGSKNEYQYSNISDYPDIQGRNISSGNTLSPFEEYSEREFKRGKLLQVKSFDGNTLRKISKCSYRSEDSESMYALTTNAYGTSYGSSGAFYFYTGSIYKLFYQKFDLEKQTETIYTRNGAIESLRTHTFLRKDTALQVSIGSKTHLVNIRKTEEEKISQKPDSKSISYQYAYNSPDPTTKELSHSQFFLAPIYTKIYFDGNSIGGKETKYAKFGNLINPKYEIEYKVANAPDTTITYTSYTPTGALQQYKEKGMPVKRIVWVANDCWPCAEIEGYIYPTIPTIPQNKAFDQNYVLNIMSQYRNSYHQPMVSRTFSNSGLVTSETDRYGVTQFFYYDKLGRLVDIKDMDGKQIKHFDYNYKHK